MPRRNVGFSKPPEPSFITRMKQEAGFIEGPSVDTKREGLQSADDLDDRSDDEAPTVVVLRDGDLTAEEVDQIKSKTSGQEKEETGGRIIFRKPVKREAGAESSADTADSNKRSRSETDTKKSKSSKSKSKQNTKLLSFQQDDEDDE